MSKTYQTATKALLLSLLILALTAWISPECLAKNGMFFASDGKGEVQMVWQHVWEFFPEKGWQLVRIDDNKVIAEWMPETRKIDLDRINPKKSASTEKLLLKLPTLTEKERKMALGLIAMGTAIDFRIGEAVGIGCRIRVGKGSHRYRLIMTDKKGATVHTLFETEPIDGWKATPPVPAPVGITASNRERAIGLFWPEFNNPPTPVISYVVQRKFGDSGWQNVTEGVFLRAKNKSDDGADEPKPVIIDTKAPLEVEITYRVIAVDLFGRRSLPGEVKVFNSDSEALVPPSSLTAKGGVNKVELSWQKSSNPFTAGYIIERTTGRADLYRPVTLKKGLANSTLTFTDTAVMGGRNYYYRIRSFDPRGKVGAPSSSAAATVLTDGAPPPPTKLSGTANPIQIKLTWQPPEKGAVGGYFIEKKSIDSDRWTRLNAHLCKRTVYNDMFPYGTVGTFEYRVVSVGLDRKRSKPSNEITVQLPTLLNVPRPYLKTVTGEKGVVRLSFYATGKKEQTDKILVVRGNTEKDLGLIIGEPLAGSATEHVDTFVRPGEDYWYALIAEGKDKRRSKMSDKLFVRVKPKDIPRADRPDCEYKEKPFRHIIVQFKEPSDYLQVAVLRKTDSQKRWTTIADRVGGTDRIIDADPPQSGSVSYAILYKTENGTSGVPSKQESIDIPSNL